MSISATFTMPGDLTIANATTVTAGLMSSTDKSKLDGIEVSATGDMTGSEIVSSINTALGGTVWQVGVSGGYSTPSEVVVALDTWFTDQTPQDLTWRDQHVDTVFGRAGPAVIAVSGDYAIPQITDLVSALSVKSPTNHAHAISDTTDLTTQLSALKLIVKSSAAVVVSGAPVLDFYGAAVSAGNGGAVIAITGQVASVFSRTGAVAAVSGDYDLSKIGETGTYKLYTATDQSLIAQATAALVSAALVKRDTSGRFQAQSPLATADVATKGYIDNLVPSSGNATAVVPFTVGSTQVVDMSAANSEFPNLRRVFLDMTNVTDFYLAGRCDIAGAAGSKYFLQYSVDGTAVGGTTWTAVSGAEFSLTSTGHQASSIVTWPSAARTNHTWTRLMSVGGNATADPSVVMLTGNFVYKTGGGGGGGGAVSSVFGRTGAVVAVSGDYIANQVTVTPVGNMSSTHVQAALQEHQGDIDALTAGTVPDNSITNAKLADVATATIKGRLTAATGDPEDLTAAQTRTLLSIVDGVSSIYGRTGAIVAVSGDYVASKVNEDATRVVMSATERTRLAAMEDGATKWLPAMQAITVNSTMTSEFAEATGTVTSITLPPAPINLARISNFGSNTITILGGSRTITGGSMTLAPGTDSTPSTICFSIRASNGSWRKI